MGLLEEYHEYKKGELCETKDKNIVRFFKTNPTDEQITLIDKYKKRHEMLYTLLAVLMLMLGLLYGGMVGYELGIFKGLLMAW